MTVSAAVDGLRESLSAWPSGLARRELEHRIVRDLTFDVWGSLRRPERDLLFYTATVSDDLRDSFQACPGFPDILLRGQDVRREMVYGMADVMCRQAAKSADWLCWAAAIALSDGRHTTQTFLGLECRRGEVARAVARLGTWREEARSGLERLHYHQEIFRVFDVLKARNVPELSVLLRELFAPYVAHMSTLPVYRMVLTGL